MTVQSYGNTEKSDLKPDFALRIVAAFSQPRDESLGAWHLACG